MKKLDLSIDYNTIKNDDNYKKIWGKIAGVEIKMIEKIGKCKHNINDSFIYETPYKKPQDVCNALLHVLDLYIWRVAFGFPSWEKNDRKIFRIHCPSKKGTVWEMKRLPDHF